MLDCFDCSLCSVSPYNDEVSELVLGSDSDEESELSCGVEGVIVDDKPLPGTAVGVVLEPSVRVCVVSIGGD